jgi:dihydroorotase-like cyclic amidohydrolase
MLKPTYLSYLAVHTKFPDFDGLKDLKLAFGALTNIQVHLCNLADPQALCLASNMKKKNARITWSVRAQHLMFNASDIENGNTSMKTFPPIRTK